MPESEEDEKIRNVLRYVRNEEVALGDPLIERIDSEVRAINRDGEWVNMASMFMTMEEHARALGRLAGKEEGRAEGLVEGEARLAKLIEALIGSGRSDELGRVAADPAYRESLFKKFGIA